MKLFYLYRKEDVHGNSGTGVVAEGVIFDSGLVSMTWLSAITTVTMFTSLKQVAELHSHEGRTKVIVEGHKKNAVLFEHCREEARRFATKAHKGAKV
jgi:hypothetical protein